MASYRCIPPDIVDFTNQIRKFGTPEQQASSSDMLLHAASVELSKTIQMDPDRTVSAQAAEARNLGKQWGVELCSLLDQIDPGHCDKALAFEQTQPIGFYLALERKWGVKRALSVVVYRWQLALQPYGIQIWPHITSGYRSEVYNQQLQARWDAGDRAGLTARPPSIDDHTKGLAIDVALYSPDEQAFVAGIWKELDRNAIWGGDWRSPDPVHYALRF